MECGSDHYGKEYFLNIYLQSNFEHSYFSTTQPPSNSEMRIMSTLIVKLWVLSIASLTCQPHELLLETKSFQWNIDLDLSCIWSLIKHTSLTYSSSSLSSASIFTSIAVSTMINWVSILLLFYYVIPTDASKQSSCLALSRLVFINEDKPV